MKLLFAASAVLALAACSKPAATHVAPPPPVAMVPIAPPAPAAAPETPPVIMATYLCAGGNTLEAGYPTPTTALVVWQGKAYTLTQAAAPAQTPAASAARYSGAGLQWWSKSLTDATLATLKVGEEIASDPGTACVVQVAPPAPGTPGALPPGAPPVPEVGPGSAQGAAEVARNYYALLEKRNSASAAAYRVDGTPENLSQYVALHADVGIPGAIVSAGNTLTVEVPVVLSGRMADGSALKKSGKVLLKRTNDAPSATPEQRTWRIDRISLK